MDLPACAVQQIDLDVAAVWSILLSPTGALIPHISWPWLNQDVEGCDCEGQANCLINLAAFGRQQNLSFQKIDEGAIPESDVRALNKVVHFELQHLVSSQVIDPKVTVARGKSFSWSSSSTWHCTLESDPLCKADAHVSIGVLDDHHLYRKINRTVFIGFDR